MNAIDITKRANNVERLALTSLHGACRPADTSKLVLACYSYPAARKCKARQTAILVHRDILLLEGSAGADGPAPALPVPAPGGAAAPVIHDAAEDDADDNALPLDELAEERR